MANSKKKQSSKKTYTFGTCRYAKIQPKRTTLSTKTKVLNIHLTFEEALKLNVAVDECIRKLNSYKRSTVAGKKASLNLTIHLQLKRVAVNQGTI